MPLGVVILFARLRVADRSGPKLSYGRPVSRFGAVSGSPSAPSLGFSSLPRRRFVEVVHAKAIPLEIVGWKRIVTQLRETILWGSKDLGHAGLRVGGQVIDPSAFRMHVTGSASWARRRVFMIWSRFVAYRRVVDIPASGNQHQSVFWAQASVLSIWLRSATGS